MMRCVLYLVLITILLLLLQYHHVAAATAAVSTTRNATTNSTKMSRDMQQKLALYEFKLSFSIDNSPQSCDTYYDDNGNTSWHPKTMNWSMDSDYCKWDGVTCNHTTGDVIGLDLNCRRLVGSISTNSTLFQLSHLQVINFEFVDISGIIPEEIFHLPNLKELSISPGWRPHSTSPKVSASLNFPKVRWGSNNTLQMLYLRVKTIIGGVLPQEIFYLPNLIELDLDSTNLSISVPKLKSDISTTLHTLSLGGAFLGGVIPEDIFHLPKLEELNIISVSVSLPKLKWDSSNTLQTLELIEINIIGGVLPDSIGYLNSLTYLSLWDCNLSGPIPEFMGNLTQLNYLGLSDNQLSSQIPDCLANLKKLEHLELERNNLNGEFPSWVANLTQLQALSLTDNSLTGSLPSYLPPHSLLQLYHLDLYNNSLSGTIPSWLFQLPSLPELAINSNQFTGPLPYQFNSSTSSSLQSFWCHNNLLNGTIPKSFSDQLVSLITLDLSSNKFSGDLDLETFSHLQHLHNLYLSDNSLSLRITSTTTLPPSLESLGLSSCKITKFPHLIASLANLTSLDLSNNQIDGKIPNWIGLTGRSSLQYLNLSHNSLTGGLDQLPWSSLIHLDLQSNKFDGSLSSSIYNSTSLQILILSHNNFSGVFPVCHGNLSYNLSVLDLRMNNIIGNRPLALSKFQNLRSLNMHGNKLQGTIPLSFSKFDSLEVLDLGGNNINDMFPHCLEALPKLQVLILKSNKFHGIINNISQKEHPFPNLRIIDLSDNEFSGPLPGKYIKNFKGMMNEEVNKVPLVYMGDYYYHDSISLVIKGVEFELVKILTVFTTIDLSRNMFEGNIPAYIGKLVSLRYLNLSHNQLVGNIPSSIGDLLMLGSLDLSSNQLVGEIPQHLTHINDLSDLNLSQNNLSGPIPEGMQFNTFENDSYAGNVGLCGRPLSRKCGRELNESHEEEEDENGDYFFDDFSWEAVVIGYGCGVVVGFVGGYIMFMAGKPK